MAVCFVRRDAANAHFASGDNETCLPERGWRALAEASRCAGGCTPPSSDTRARLRELLLGSALPAPITRTQMPSSREEESRRATRTSLSVCAVRRRQLTWMSRHFNRRGNRCCVIISSVEFSTNTPNSRICGTHEAAPKSLANELPNVFGESPPVHQPWFSLSRERRRPLLESPAPSTRGRDSATPPSRKRRRLPPETKRRRSQPPYTPLCAFKRIATGISLEQLNAALS